MGLDGWVNFDPLGASRKGRGIVFSLTKIFLSRIYSSLVSSKGETEPERKETRQKVDEDRKHEYPFQ